MQLIIVIIIQINVLHALQMKENLTCVLKKP